MGVLTQSVAVECGADGTPQGLRWNGRDYVLAERPVRWFERRRWWAEEVRAEKGRGAGPGQADLQPPHLVVDETGAAPLQTLDVAHHLDSGRWRLVRVHEHAQDLRRSA